MQDRESARAKFLVDLQEHFRKSEHAIGAKELYGAMVHIMSLYRLREDKNPLGMREEIGGLPGYRYEVFSLFLEIHRKVIAFMHSPEEGAFLFAGLLRHATDRFASTLENELIAQKPSKE